MLQLIEDMLIDKVPDYSDIEYIPKTEDKVYTNVETEERDYIIEGRKSGYTSDNWETGLQWYCRKYTDKIRVVIKNNGSTAMVYQIFENIAREEVENAIEIIASLNARVIDILPPVSEIKVKVRNHVTGASNSNSYTISYVGVEPR